MSNPVHDVIHVLKPLFSNTSTTYAHITLSTLRTIFGGDAIAEIFTYMCLHGAATPWVLECKMHLPESSVYGALKRLRAAGIVKPTSKIFKLKRSTGGRRVSIWALEGATRIEVNAARRLHQKTPRPHGKGEKVDWLC